MDITPKNCRLLFAILFLVFTLTVIDAGAGDEHCRRITKVDRTRCLPKTNCWYYQESFELLSGFENITRCDKRNNNKGKKICCPPDENILNVVRVVEKKCEELCWNARKVKRELKKKANTTEFPHVVSIGYKYKDRSKHFTWKCSGTLISDRFVLTTAHCAKPNTKERVELAVGLGAKNDSEYNETTFFDQIQPHIHPKYNGSKHLNDIALLELNVSVKFKDGYAKAICLNTLLDLPKNLNTVVIAAFRRVYKGTYHPDKRGTLYQGSVGFEHETRCENQFGNNYTSSLMFCASSNQTIPNVDGSFPCDGDSGGPVQILSFNEGRTPTPMQIGIISFGYSECENKPFVFTKISPYIDWIQKIVWPEVPAEQEVD